MKKVKIFINFSNGFGDQYNCLLVAKKTFDDFLNLGYDIKLYSLVGHKYFNLKIPMTEVFDFSLFGVDYIENAYYDKFEEYLEGYKLVNRDHQSLVIYTESEDAFTKGYEPSRISYEPFYTFGNDSLMNQNFLKKDIIEYSNQKFDFLGEDFVVYQLRLNDMLLESSYDQICEDPSYVNIFNKVNNFIEQNQSKKILLTAPNYNIINHFREKYNNVFHHEFKHKDLRLHNVYDLYTDESLNQKYLEHAKDILAEMHIFSKSISMVCVSNWRSSFLTYGIVHNIHHKDERLKGISIFE